MLSIRMTRVGSKKKPYFRVVVTEARSKRESDFVETVGTYNPRTKPAEQVLRTWQGVAGPNFSLSASPTSLAVNQGATGTASIGITRTGFTGSVDLSATGLRLGMLMNFNVPRIVHGVKRVVR